MKDSAPIKCVDYGMLSPLTQHNLRKVVARSTNNKPQKAAEVGLLWRQLRAALPPQGKELQNPKSPPPT